MMAEAPVKPDPVEWFERTGHCGVCGQPGEFCVCRKPCGCAHLHPVGSGLEPDAVEAFIAEVPGDHPEMF